MVQKEELPVRNDRENFLQLPQTKKVNYRDTQVTTDGELKATTAGNKP